MSEERKYVVVRFKSGRCEWHTERGWETHKRLVPGTFGEAITGPMPREDAVRLTRLANSQHKIETQPQT